MKLGCILSGDIDDSIQEIAYMTGIQRQMKWEVIPVLITNSIRKNNIWKVL